MHWCQFNTRLSSMGIKTFGILCITILFQVSLGEDKTTSACYSANPNCGEHKIACPEQHTIVITNAQYAHPSRTTSCQRVVKDCSSRYFRSCCTPRGKECYNTYEDSDAKNVLQGCLGSRYCSHMTKQVVKKCSKYKLHQSTFAVLSYRCVNNSHILGYNMETSITSKQVYLRYTSQDDRPGQKYGCDVIGPDGVEVKVLAVDISVGSYEDENCSAVEIEKSAKVKRFSCDKKAMHFMSELFTGSVPFSVNLVDETANAPDAAWILIESKTDITVECGKVRDSQGTTPPRTSEESDSSAPSLTPSSGTSGIAWTPSSEYTASIAVNTNERDSNSVSFYTTNAYSSSDLGKQPDSEANTDTRDPNNPSQQPKTSGSNHTDGVTVAVYRASTKPVTVSYVGLGGGLALLFLLIIVISVICYRRKRYKRYQSRKIEEERNIPDGEEHSSNKTEDVKGLNITPKGDNGSPAVLKKGEPFSTPVATSTPSEQSLIGRNKRKPKESSGPPRTSQPRDSDGYLMVTGDDESSRRPTVEFYYNPGFKTTIDNIKIV